MTSRLEFCKQTFNKHKEKEEVGAIVQQLQNLLPTYKEKVVFQEYVRSSKRDASS